MNDFTKIIEQIKISEMKVASVAKEIKEFEENMRKIDEEAEIIKQKEKELTEEINYKKKIVTEKQWELEDLERATLTLEKIGLEKEKLLEETLDQLDSMQNSVWATRRTIATKTAEFIENNNFLAQLDSLENIIQKQKERKKLFNSIEILEEQVKSVEKIYTDLKTNWDMMEHLGKERNGLIDYEQSSDVMRLQNKISNCTVELAALDKELSKYSERAVLTPHDISMFQQNYQNVSPGPAIPVLDMDKSNTTEQDKRKIFIPKRPSYLQQSQYYPGNTQRDSSENNQF